MPRQPQSQPPSQESGSNVTVGNGDASEITNQCTPVRGAYEFPASQSVQHVCVCEVAQSCLTLCDATDCSLPGSSVHGIFQTRVLEWVPFAPCI